MLNVRPSEILLVKLDKLIDKTGSGLTREEFTDYRGELSEEVRGIHARVRVLENANLQSDAKLNEGITTSRQLLEKGFNQGMQDMEDRIVNRVKRNGEN